MSVIRSQRQVGWITEDDVRNLREELHPGDYVLVNVEKEDDSGDQVQIKTQIKKEQVVAKYPHLVVVTGAGTKIHTITYKEILMNELKRMRRRNERRMG